MLLFLVRELILYSLRYYLFLDQKLFEKFRLYLIKTIFDNVLNKLTN